MSIAPNPNFGSLEENYLFSRISKEVSKCRRNDIIKLGIGDVTLPLPQSAVKAITAAITEQGSADGVHGYAPEGGYSFLRREICRRYGTLVSEDEIYVSDGAKSDIGALCELFDLCDVYIPDPVYPAYLDASLLRGNRVHFLPSCKETGFLPVPEDIKHSPCLIFLCSPSNPTGVVFDRQRLEAWVRFACESGSVIIYDACYEAYICESMIPHSIYEINGADRCAVEINSLSKSAGFTGVRCGWTVIPRSLECRGKNLGELWRRRQSARFNGVSYAVQRGAQATLICGDYKACVDYYMENAKLMAEFFTARGEEFCGGVNSPYIWKRCPDGMGSWEYFDLLLNEYGIVVTPGAGFGRCGEGFVRISSFCSHDSTLRAIEKLKVES